jgi:hypothetical protein
LRAGRDSWPACTALLQRFRAEAHGLLACQQRLKTKGLAHDPRAPCAPLRDTMPSAAVRPALRAALDCERKLATTLGRAHVGVPIRSDAIASLFGVAKLRGVGETQEAARIARRLPAFCGVPTREDAAPVLDVSGARQHALTAQVISLTKQRREGLGHPERLESLSLDPAHSQVELIPRPKNRAKYQEVINISNGYEERYGPPLRPPGRLRFLENAGPPGKRETALTS